MQKPTDFACVKSSSLFTKLYSSQPLNYNYKVITTKVLFFKRLTFISRTQTEEMWNIDNIVLTILTMWRFLLYILEAQTHTNKYKRIIIKMSGGTAK